jgi:hypothetical protein
MKPQNTPHNPMKTSTSLKLVILFAAAILIMAAQWRTVSRLKDENRVLQGVREQAEQTRTQLEQAVQAATQHESEAQSLRAEVLTLRDEIHTERSNSVRALIAALDFSITNTTTTIPDTSAALYSSPLDGALTLGPVVCSTLPDGNFAIVLTNNSARQIFYRISPQFKCHGVWAPYYGPVDYVQLWQGAPMRRIPPESIPAGEVKEAAFDKPMHITAPWGATAWRAGVVWSHGSTPGFECLTNFSAEVKF